MPTETTPLAPLNCDGYRKIIAELERFAAREPGRTEYRTKIDWIIARAQHYAEKTGLTPEAILDAWEKRRDYWYMNFYQEANQPLIQGDKVRVFETVADLLSSVGTTGFRCPACGGISTNPYECNSGKLMPIATRKVCDWKVYGLFGHMGKGVSVFVKEKTQIDKLFKPVAWEPPAP